MPTGGYTEGSDAEIYPDLARANLLRMRGQYDQARDVCLALLRRFPNNATANALLGDISAEKGDEEQAIQWYELALDVAPDAKPVRQKLEAIRQRIADREAAASAQLLGVGRKGSMTLYGLGLLGLVILVGVGSYLLGSRWGLQVPATGVVEKPIVIDNPEAATAPGPEPEAQPAAPTPRPPVAEDQEALDRLSRSPELSRRLVGVAVDPRNGRVLLTLEASPGEDARTVAAQAAVEAVSLLNPTSAIVVRVRQGDRLALVADVDRAVAERFRDLGEEPHGWPEQVLSNAWPADAGHDQPQDAPEQAPPGGGA